MLKCVGTVHQLVPGCGSLLCRKHASHNEAVRKGVGQAQSAAGRQLEAPRGLPSTADLL